MNIHGDMFIIITICTPSNSLLHDAVLTSAYNYSYKYNYMHGKLNTAVVKWQQYGLYRQKTTAIIPRHAAIIDSDSQELFLH